MVRECRDQYFTFRRETAWANRISDEYHMIHTSSLLHFFVSCIINV